LLEQLIKVDTYYVDAFTFMYLTVIL